MTEDPKESDQPSVTLMTIHAAKGLEYPYVYLVGIEEGFLPSPLMQDDPKGLEEECRLLYVALTRASKRVTLNFARLRNHFGQYKVSRPSRFIFQIDRNLIQLLHSASQGAKGQKRSHTPLASPPRKLSSQPLLRQSTNSTPLDVKIDTRVRHPRFGNGTVIGIQSTSHGQSVKVNFDTSGTKTLLLAFAKLTST